MSYFKVIITLILPIGALIPIGAVRVRLDFFSSFPLNFNLLALLGVGWGSKKPRKSDIGVDDRRVYYRFKYSRKVGGFM